ncbi:MAG TPA: hypothetical protein VKM55_16500 [Candidatus Lokiarchaeia archaeon]|nr:hypothetical protein [Candidatus Lokiarchaeia archaeon]
MKINLRLQNFILLVVFVVTVIACMFYDFHLISINPASAPIAIWYLAPIDAWKIVYACAAAAAAVAFLSVALRYNKIRQHKTEQYLASLIFFSAIYQCAAYILHVLQIMSGGLNSIVQIGLKFYMPLDILSLLFFSFMSMEVFIKPAIGLSRESPIEKFILVLEIGGIIIGILITLFTYTPDGSPFEIITGTIGFSWLALIAIIVSIVISIIIKMRRSIAEPIQARALQAIALQLILLAVVTLLMALVEMASFINMTNEVAYIIRIAQSLLSVMIAWLYFPAFINPSEKKEAKQD